MGVRSCAVGDPEGAVLAGGAGQGLLDHQGAGHAVPVVRQGTDDAQDWLGQQATPPGLGESEVQQGADRGQPRARALGRRACRVTIASDCTATWPCSAKRVASTAWVKGFQVARKWITRAPDSSSFHSG